MKTTMFKVFALVSMILVLGFASASFADTIDPAAISKADFLSSVFSDTPTTLDGGYGASGATKSGVTFSISSPVTTVNDGTEHKSGTYTTDGSQISVYFDRNSDWKAGANDYTDVDISQFTKVSEVVDAIAESEVQDLAGGKVLILKSNIQFTVGGIVTLVQDGTDYHVGDTVKGKGQQASVWMMDKVEQTVLTADKLLTFNDVRNCDRFEVIKDLEKAEGAIQVYVAPYTTIEVADSWSVLNTDTGDIPGGKNSDGSYNTYSTGYSTSENRSKVTFRIDWDYWTEKVTSSNISEFMETMNTEGNWDVMVLKEAAKGKLIEAEVTSDIIIMTRNSNGNVSNPDHIDDSVTDDILVAKRNAINNSDGQLFASVANVEAASPVAAASSQNEDGKWYVKFFAAAERLSLSGSNLYKVKWDETGKDAEGKIRVKLVDANGNEVATPTVSSVTAAATNAYEGLYLETTDKRAIGEMSLYLSSKGSSSNGNNGGGDTGNGGGGGGGCSTSGFGIFGLLLALPILGKKRS